MEKKSTRQLRGRGFPPKKKIPRTLLEVFGTSVGVSCTVFNVPSAGNDPRRIYWSYEFLFFRLLVLRTWRPAQTGPGGQNRGFPRSDPMILCIFVRRFRWKTLESHNSKQMMVYEKITCFIKNRFFFSFFSSKNRFFD